MKKKTKISLKNKKKLSKNEENEIDFDNNEEENQLENLANTEKPSKIPLNPLKKPKSAWIDKHDEEISIDISKIARLRKLRKNDSETKIKGDEYQERLEDFYSQKLKNLDFFKWTSTKPLENAENQENFPTDFKEILNKDVDLFESLQEELSAGLISLDKLGSLSRKDQHKSVVQTLDFHENNEVFLSAGYDKLMKIYSVRRRESQDEFVKSLKVLKTVYFEDFPLKMCRFLGNSKILCSGLKKHLLIYDVIAEKNEKFASNLFTSYFEKHIENFSLSKDGKLIALNNNQGDIIVISSKNMEFLYRFKSNEPCHATYFTEDTRFLFSVGNQGKIYQWDLNKRQIFDCFSDNATSSINCLDFGIRDSLLAVGGANGVVNLYDRDWKTGKINRFPLKEIQNLTTEITNLNINKKGELMVVASKWKKNAIRIVHLGNKTVFSNWPNVKTKLQFVTAMGMSMNCKYLGLGNDEGNVFLYNFRHYNY